MCEQPRIGPYADQIKNLLEKFYIEESFIGVKATTTEKMELLVMVMALLHIKLHL